MIDKQQIETEAQRHYLKGSASYHAFIYDAEWVLKEGEENETN